MEIMTSTIGVGTAGATGGARPRNAETGEGGGESIFSPRNNLPSLSVGHRRRRWGGREGTCPPKIRENIFSGNFYVKFGHFSGKSHVKLGNFVNFSGK